MALKARSAALRGKRLAVRSEHVDLKGRPVALRGEHLAPEGRHIAPGGKQAAFRGSLETSEGCTDRLLQDRCAGPRCGAPWQPQYASPHAVIGGSVRRTDPSGTTSAPTEYGLPITKRCLGATRVTIEKLPAGVPVI